MIIYCSVPPGFGFATDVHNIMERKEATGSPHLEQNKSTYKLSEEALLVMQRETFKDESTNEDCRSVDALHKIVDNIDKQEITAPEGWELIRNTLRDVVDADFTSVCSLLKKPVSRIELSLNSVFQHNCHAMHHY